MKRTPYHNNRASWAIDERAGHTGVVALGVFQRLATFKGGETAAWVADGEIVIDFGGATFIDAEDRLFADERHFAVDKKGRFKFSSGHETYATTDKEFEWENRYHAGDFSVEEIDGVEIASRLFTQSDERFMQTATVKVKL